MSLTSSLSRYPVASNAFQWTAFFFMCIFHQFPPSWMDSETVDIGTEYYLFFPEFKYYSFNELFVTDEPHQMKSKLPLCDWPTKFEAKEKDNDMFLLAVEPHHILPQ